MALPPLPYVRAMVIIRFSPHDVRLVSPCFSVRSFSGMSSLSSHVEQLAVTLAGSEAVEVKAVLAFDVFLRKQIPIEMITDVRMRPADKEAAEERPGIVGHIVQAGEDLWSLAKKYMTTVEGIMEINGLDSENVRPGDKLLILKENVSIL